MSVPVISHVGKFFTNTIPNGAKAIWNGGRAVMERTFPNLPPAGQKAVLIAAIAFAALLVVGAVSYGIYALVQRIRQRNPEENNVPNPINLRPEDYADEDDGALPFADEVSLPGDQVNADQANQVEENEFDGLGGLLGMDEDDQVDEPQEDQVEQNEFDGLGGLLGMDEDDQVEEPQADHVDQADGEQQENHVDPAADHVEEQQLADHVEEQQPEDHVEEQQPAEHVVPGPASTTTSTMADLMTPEDMEVMYAMPNQDVESESGLGALVVNAVVGTWNFFFGSNEE